MKTTNQAARVVSIVAAFVLVSSLSLPTAAFASPSSDGDAHATFSSEQEEILQALEEDSSAEQPVDEEALAAAADAASADSYVVQMQAAESSTAIASGEEGAVLLDTHEIYLTEGETHSEFYTETLLMVNYNFTVKEDALVVFRLYASGDEYENVGLLSLQDSAGEMLDAGILRGGFHNMYWTLPAGNYKVNVMASEDMLYLSGHYACMVPQSDQQIFPPTNKSIEDAALVDLNRMILGVHYNIFNDSPDDAALMSGSYYKFNITEPSIVSVTLATYGETLFGIYDEKGELVYDAAGNVLGALLNPVQGSGNATIDCKTLQPGTYYLGVFSSQNRDAWGEQYVCIVRSTPEWESFRDVDFEGTTADAWMADWIIQAHNLGLMSGDRDGNGQLTGFFRPNDPLTRGQAVTVLYRAMTGASANEAQRPHGTDLVDLGSDPQFYWNAVSWAYGEGIITGDTDPVTGQPRHTFRPNDTISRQELAIMVWRAARSPEAADPSAYMAAVDHGTEWGSATAALTWTAEQDILSGSIENGVAYLNPSSATLRGQAAKIFVSSLEFLA